MYHSKLRGVITFVNLAESVHFSVAFITKRFLTENELCSAKWKHARRALTRVNQVQVAQHELRTMDTEAEYME